MKEKRSVTMITSDRKPGGIGLAFNNYTARLLDLGYHVHVMVRREADHIKSVLAPEVAAGRVTIHHISKAETFLMKKFRYTSRRLVRVMRKSDAIINHTNRLCAALAKTGTAVISIWHSNKSRGLEYADRVICINKTQRKLLAEQGIGEDRTVYLPHFFEKDVTENPYLCRRHIPVTVGAAGRFVQKKGFEDYIRAAARIRAEQGDAATPEFRFELAGDGPERQALENLNEQLGNPVTFAGWVDIRDLAKRIDLFCLPSHVENFGYVLCEVMSYGVPCISSDRNGPRDILENGEWGMMYPAGDVDRLTGLLQSLVQAEDILTARLNALSELTWKRISMEEFSIATFNKRLQALLDSVKKV